jgi:hypothetical protein
MKARSTVRSPAPASPGSFATARLRRCLLAALVGSLLLPATASAYLDPGTGSMLLQLLVGGAAGAVVLVKLFWRRLLSLLPSSRRREPDAQD